MSEYYNNYSQNPYMGNQDMGSENNGLHTPEPSAPKRRKSSGRAARTAKKIGAITLSAVLFGGVTQFVMNLRGGVINVDASVEFGQQLLIHHRMTQGYDRNLLQDRERVPDRSTTQRREKRRVDQYQIRTERGNTVDCKGRIARRLGIEHPKIGKIGKQRPDTGRNNCRRLQKQHLIYTSIVHPFRVFQPKVSKHDFRAAYVSTDPPQSGKSQTIRRFANRPHNYRAGI